MCKPELKVEVSLQDADQNISFNLKRRITRSELTMCVGVLK